MGNLYGIRRLGQYSKLPIERKDCWSAKQQLGVLIGRATR